MLQIFVTNKYVYYTAIKWQLISGKRKLTNFDFNFQLRKAVMDHVSDSFLETNVPLLVLIEAAKNGNEKEVKEYAQVFREHANKLIEVRWYKPS